MLAAALLGIRIVSECPEKPAFQLATYAAPGSYTAKMLQPSGLV
jgi:hypothetical protein